MKKKCSRSVFLIGSTESVTSIDHRMNQVVGYNSIDISIAPISRQTFIFKRTVDIFLSILISFAIIPASLFIALIIKITSSGPVLFTQYRTGINGQHFKLYKFRTMKVHQEEGGQVTQAVENDTRTTKFGRFLRKTSLDELPQILNVFQGNMSLVGPRPHAIPHNEYYKDLIGFYMQRQMVKPGVTGWAQINGYRGQTDTLEKMKRRVEYDIWYINNWSLLLDLKIIIKTVFKGFINKNA